MGILKNIVGHNVKIECWKNGCHVGICIRRQLRVGGGRLLRGGSKLHERMSTGIKLHRGTSLSRSQTKEYNTLI